MLRGPANTAWCSPAAVSPCPAHRLHRCGSAGARTGRNRPVDPQKREAAGTRPERATCGDTHTPTRCQVSPPKPKHTNPGWPRAPHPACDPPQKHTNMRRTQDTRRQGSTQSHVHNTFCRHRLCPERNTHLLSAYCMLGLSVGGGLRGTGDEAGTTLCSGALEADCEPGNRHPPPAPAPQVIADAIDCRGRKQTL